MVVLDSGEEKYEVKLKAEEGEDSAEKVELWTAKQVLTAKKRYDKKHPDLSAPITMDKGEWACPTCTFANAKGMRKCKICATPKPKAEGSSSQSLASSKSGGGSARKRVRGSKENVDANL